MTDTIAEYGILLPLALFALVALAPLTARLGGGTQVGDALRRARGPLAERALATLAALALLAVGVKLAGALWSDPRPFIVDHSIHPTIAHALDNGFVSDHTARAAVLAGLVVGWRRSWGLVMVALALGLGMARVAAGVHHVPDVLGGLAVGLLCSAGGLAIARLAVARVPALARARRAPAAG